MLHHDTKILRRRSNANAVLGHAPGTLLCVSTGAGGGFFPSPEHVQVWVRDGGWIEDLFPRVEFPEHDKDRYDYSVWNDQDVFYLEEHRLKYGWPLPVTEEVKV